MSDGSSGAADSGRIQNFIFARELAEVYLLLDHLSGRSDKGLADQESLITEICNIGWPPKGSDIEQAMGSPSSSASSITIASGMERAMRSKKSRVR